MTWHDVVPGNGPRADALSSLEDEDQVLGLCEHAFTLCCQELPVFKKNSSWFYVIQFLFVFFNVWNRHQCPQFIEIALQIL